MNFWRSTNWKSEWLAMGCLIAGHSFCLSDIPAAFTRVETGPIGTDKDVSIGCAWADIDNDGDLDLFVANRRGPDVIYWNDSGAGFAREEVFVEPDNTDHTLGCAWGDFDNDGWLDVYLTKHGSTDETEATETRTNALYRNLGAGVFERMSAERTGDVVAVGGNSVSGAWADFDLDGRIDLFVANWPKHDNYMFRNAGNGQFNRLFLPITEDHQNSEGSSWSDFDNDGDPDLFFAKGSIQRNSLFENLGGGRFSARLDNAVTQEVKSSRGGTWGDYDNDGRPDLLVANEYDLSLFHNDGGGQFTRLGPDQLPEVEGNFSGGVWGDYDNDGWLDLYVASGRGDKFEKNCLFRNNGDGSFSTVETGRIASDPGLSWSCAWGDYDNDGFLDLYVTNGAYLNADHPGKLNYLYHNEGNENRWLKVRCIGSVSNRTGIGAKVKAQAIIGGSTMWQMREISGGMGAYSGGQDGLLAHFGLRDAERVEKLLISWPSGFVQELWNVKANQSITVTEPNLRIKEFFNDTIRMEVTGQSSKPIYVQASADLKDWKSVGIISELKGAVTVVEQFDSTRHGRFYRIADRRPE